MMLSTMKFFAAFLTASLCLESASALSLSPSTKQQQTISRRDAAASIFSIGVTTTTAFFTPIAQNANAAEDNQVLSDEEMAARIARKMELLQKSKAGGGGGGGGGGVKSPYADIRSDVNPEAAVNLRSRSAVDNAKIAIEKQKELKSRDNAKKREDLCEMLGRGC